MMITTLRKSLLLVVQRYLRKPGQADALILTVLWALFLTVAVVALLVLSRSALALPLSESDRINVTIFDGADFSGKYQVNIDGAIELPYVGPVTVIGKEPAEAAISIRDALVQGRFMKSDVIRVSVQVLELAPVEVYVEGAVFFPGRLRVNAPPARDRAPDRLDEIPGARMSERYLSDALRAAGGIRPTADHRNIRLMRGNTVHVIDFNGIIDGKPIDDMPVLAGDRIVVPDTGLFNTALVRPSRITPPGIKVYVSNTTAGTNTPIAGSVGTISLPYGSRLSHAVAAGNCSGGTYLTTAMRSVTFSRAERVTGETKSITVSTEALLQGANDYINPLLMEGDTVSCYESVVANIRDVFRAIADVILPFRSISPSISR